MIHRLIEEAPLCAAAAIQRGPSTVAILKSSTSQKPMTRGNCGRAADSGVAAICRRERYQIFRRFVAATFDQPCAAAAAPFVMQCHSEGQDHGPEESLLSGPTAT